MKHRLFIAINLPDNLKKKLSKLLAELEKHNKDQPIKWASPNQLHLTLHFLGYLEKQQIPEIEKILEKVAKNYKPFKMQIQGISAFPNLGNPRVIFLECQEIGGQIAQSIQKATGVELERSSFNVESRPWREHITLGRVKNKCQPNLPKVQVTNGQFSVNSIELMESKLAPGGAKYTVVKSFNLG